MKIKMSLYHKYKISGISIGSILSVCLLMLSSCAGEQDLPFDKEIDDAIVVMASVNDVMSSRAYQDQGQIMTGHYYMTYPNFSDNNTYSVCDVNFFEGRGVTKTTDGYELKWQDVGALNYDSKKTCFWMDNVPKPEDDPDAIVVPFTDSYNPFVAGEFDDDEGSNDLLWGYVQMAPEASQVVSMHVHHWMARVNVIVTVDNSNENADIVNFSEGSVKITNLIHKGISFNRISGVIDLGEEPQYEDLYLTVNGDWGSKNDDPNTKNITYFQTKNFVLPPQQLTTDETRPRLVLEVPQNDGTIRTYSGVIPRIMTVNGSPANLAFDQEKNLTLKVKLSQDLLYIESIYAYLQDWVNKGTHLVTANQAGIYSDDDLMSLIGYYQEDNTDEMIHYGYRLEDDWKFDIFTDITVNVDDVAGKMDKGPEFSFELPYHSLTIILKDGSVVKYLPVQHQQAAEALYSLLRKGEIKYPDESVSGEIDP